MKLYNRTKIPNEILEPLLVAAGRSVRARTGQVAVQVNPGQYGIRGMAYCCLAVRLGKRFVNVDGGYFKISLPKHGEPLKNAKSFFEVAQHEFAHIKDFQEGELRFSFRVNGRRPDHDDRPEELRAFHAVRYAKTSIDTDTLIQNLAAELQNHSRAYSRVAAYLKEQGV